MITKREAAIISAYTKPMLKNLSDRHEYIEKLFGHPVFTHQMGNKEFSLELRALAKPDFVKLYEGIV